MTPSSADMSAKGCLSASVHGRKINRSDSIGMGYSRNRLCRESYAWINVTRAEFAHATSRAIRRGSGFVGDYRVQIGPRLVLAQLRHYPVAHHISVALTSSGGAVQDDHLGNLPRQDVLIG